MRLGLVGCGVIGSRRASTAVANGHTVSMVCDVLPARAADLGKRVNGRVAESWQELVRSDVDAVMVATTHDMLPTVGLEALRQGKHVLLEKPGARNALELEPLAGEARARSLVAKVGYNHRFHPALTKAHTLVGEGALGPLMFIRGRYGHGGRPGYEKEWRSNPDISGGGELIDQGSHLIDLSRWFLGDLSVEYGKLPTYYWDASVDDNCFLALESRLGQMAWLHASWTEWKNTFSFEVFGRDAKLSIEGLGGSYGTERLTFYKMLPGMGPPETTTWEFPFPDASWDADFLEFAAAIAESRRPMGDVEDAVAVLRIIDELYARFGSKRQE